MSYLFKKGDVVRYKKDQISHMPGNLHGSPNSKKEFTVMDVDLDESTPEYALIMFDNCPVGNGSMAYRLELVKEAPKKKKPKPEGKFAWGVFWDDDKIFSLHKTRQAARDTKLGEWYSYALNVKKIKYEIV